LPDLFIFVKFKLEVAAGDHNIVMAQQCRRKIPKQEVEKMKARASPRLGGRAMKPAKEEIGQAKKPS